MQLPTPLNVIFLPSWYPVKANPLNGIFNRELAELISESHRVLLLHITFDEVERVEKKVVDHHQNWQETIITIPNHGNAILRQWRYFKSFFQYLKSKRREMKIDLIHVQVAWKMGLPAWLAKWRYGYRYIITEHFTGYLPQDGSLRGYKKNLSLYFLKHARKVTAVSENLEKVLMKAGVKRIQTIHNRVHDVFLEAAITTNPDKSAFRFIHVSNFDDRQKQTSQIIQTFAQHRAQYPNSELRLIVPSTAYDSFVLSHPDLDMGGIKLLKQGMERDAYCHVLQGCDCLISYSQYETFGLTVAEAICAGVPVIYTPSGGPESYVEPRMGIKVDANKPDTLLAAMNEMVGAYPFDRNEIAKAARLIFAKNQILLQYSLLYQSVKK